MLSCTDSVLNEATCRPVSVEIIGMKKVVAKLFNDCLNNEATYANKIEQL